MKTILLTTLAVMMSTSVALADDDLMVTNASVDALAVGDTGIIGAATFGGIVGAASTNGTALAGSVYVDTCDCWDDVTVVNDSFGAIAVGNAAAGSVVVLGTD